MKKDGKKYKEENKMKKKLTLALSVLLAVSTSFATVGCGDKLFDEKVKRVADTRNLSEMEYTYANICATDQLGREATTGDLYNGNSVGMFYHIWHGAHETPGKVLNITEEMEKNPDYLTADYLKENSGKFHYWGEPLYGYYCSEDPFVITRHIELMMAMGVDFLAYDYTNAVAYDKQADAIFEILQKYYEQGFNVPKITFYTNTGSGNIVCGLYNRYYKDGKYSDLWYAPNGKPMIIGVADGEVSVAYKELYSYLTTDFFDFRESQWPDGKTTIENLQTGFPWMNWEYPQKNYNGMMSVSLAQHPDAKMSYGARTNLGRGFDYTKMRNKTSNTPLGTNYEGQWKTVFNNNADASKKAINQVMITGFNEWMAIKLNDGQESFFVDTFSEEYSRDVEMMKGGYGDNYVIQTLQNVRKYKYSETKHYIYDTATISLTSQDQTQWANAKVYRDMVGDAIAREFTDAFRTTTYVDNSARNDISSVSVTHDNDNLYVRVETAEAITQYNGSDVNWMNLLIKTTDGTEGFGGFDYIINRAPKADGTTSVEKSGGGYNWMSAGAGSYVVDGNVITYAIPLTTLGLTAKNCYVRIKACDNVTKYDDIMDYYVTGDSAPIGRFAYSYGY